MGVIGAFCQLCRLPLNHDHYVPEHGGRGMLKIFRSTTSYPDGEWHPEERVVHPRPENAWLCDAVAVPFGDAPVVLHGTVSDAVLTDRTTGATSFIFAGDEEAYAFHAYCHELLGAPASTSAATRGLGTYGWASVERYGGQLFELADFVAHGFGWALVDPRGDSADAARSRARIAAILADARRPVANPTLATVSDLLAADRDWRGLTMHDEEHRPETMIHFRQGLSERVDVTGYATLVWAMKEYDGAFANAAALQELEAFHAAAKPAVEAGGTAIVAFVSVDPKQLQFLAYTRDEAATRAALDALPVGPATRLVEYDNEVDPTWKVYFDQVDPRRYA